MASNTLPRTAVDLTLNPPGAHKQGPAWEHQQKWGYLRKRLTGGMVHSVAILPNGTAVGCGSDNQLQLDGVNTWTNLVQIVCGGTSTIGLRDDGTILLTGYIWPMDEEIPTSLSDKSTGTLYSQWKDVVFIAASYHREFHMAGLTKDGHVYAYGYNAQYGQCDVEGWCDISEIAVTLNATIGVRRDGTVVYCGQYDNIKALSSWQNIEHIYTSSVGGPIVGVTYDGRVVCNEPSRFDVSGWKDVIYVSVGSEIITALTGNGHVYLAGEVTPERKERGYDQALDVHVDSSDNVMISTKDTLYTYGIPMNGSLESSTSAKMLIVTSGTCQMFWLYRQGSVQTLIFAKDFNMGQDDTNRWCLLAEQDIERTVAPPASATAAPTTSKGSGGCYIATCVYGSYDCPEVWTLRRYRDDTLALTWYGRLFIKAYYTVSPRAVKWFGKTAWFRRLWLKRLDDMVKKLNGRGVENTAYKDKTIF